MTSSDPARDLATLSAATGWIDGVIRDDADALALRAPAVSGWSVEHHLAHVALANELCLRNLASLAKGAGLLVVEGGEPVAGTREALNAGRIPRGFAQAPRMVRPPELVERALLVEWQASNRRAIDALTAAPATVRASALKIPHQLLGRLDAVEWLRFAAVHSVHHLEIVADVLRSAAPGRALPALPALARPGRAP